MQAIEITTYDELDTLIGSAVTSNFNLMVIESSGGKGKTQSTRAALRKRKIDHHYMIGYTTKLSFVKDLYDNAGRLLIIDDVDTIMHDRALVAVMKQLCDTVPVKHITYSSTAKQAQSLPPGGFDTTSRVIVLCNSVGNMNDDMQALMTRGLHINFKPTVQEVVERMKLFAKDKEIVGFFDDIAWTLQDFNLRAYNQAEELKKAGLDWRKMIKQTLIVDDGIIAAYEATKNNATYDDRVKSFTARCGLAQRTYNRYMDKLQELGLIKVSGKGRGRKVTIVKKR